MSDPRYEHEFEPNRHGYCKRIVGITHCGLDEAGAPHVRWKERRTRILRDFPAGFYWFFQVAPPAVDSYNPTIVHVDSNGLVWFIGSELDSTLEDVQRRGRLVGPVEPPKETV